LIDPNESASDDFEPDDDLLESLPADEAGGRGPDEPTDPTQPDDGEAEPEPDGGEGKGPLAALKRHREKKRGRAITDQPAYGFWLVVIALVLVTAAFIVTVLHYKPADAVTVMGVLTGIVGALVGAYFGVRGATYASLVTHGSERRDDHEQRGDHQQRDNQERQGREQRDRRTRRQGH
jgi:hypothetical protein